MTGDAADCLKRLKAVLPAGWFPDNTPILDGILSGGAYAWSWIYSMLDFVRAQARRLTASGVFLDMIATDFFGDFLARLTNESDAQFSARIGRELFREKATRAGVIAALTDLTGRAPKVFEPSYPLDTGGYSTGGVGYNVAGGYGSLLLPYQFFVTAYRPSGSGIASVAGWNTIAATAPYNALLLSNGQATVTAGTDVPLILPGYVVTKCVTISPSSSVACFAVATVSDASFYDASVWVWIPAGTTLVSAGFQPESGVVAGSVVAGVANVATVGAWQRLETTFTASGTATNLVVRVNGPAANKIYAALLRVDPGGSTLIAPGGYGVGAIEYGSTAMIAGQVTDAAIYATVNNVRPVVSIGWTAISN